MLYPARNVTPSTGCQVRLTDALTFGTILFWFQDRLAWVSSSSRMYLARSLMMFTRTAPVHSQLRPDAPAMPEYRMTSCPAPTNGPYMRWDRVFTYRAAHSGDETSCGGSPSGTPSTTYPRVLVRHWNRSHSQDNRPPAMA